MLASRRFWRRVVIEKPFGHSLDSARELNADILRTLARGPDLPDRSLPRQGHGSEHHGVPLRQRAVRTDLEPRPDRSRADHRGGDGGRGAARRRSTRRPGRCATWSPIMSSRLLSLVAMEPPVGFDAASIRDKEGRCVRRDARRSSRRQAVRGQYGAGAVLGKYVQGLSATSRRWLPDSERRDLCRHASSRSTTGAGPACRSTSVPAST